MPIKVLKFGGTSVGSHLAMEQAYHIVQQNANGNKLIVVLSACSGVTDTLLKISEMCLDSNRTETNQLVEELENRHIQLIVDLFRDGYKTAQCIKTVNFIFESLKKLIEGVRILGEITPKIVAEILSYGEILSTNIFYQYLLQKELSCYLLDAREVIYTDNVYLNAKPDLAKISLNGTKITNIFKNYKLIITQGFIGNWSKETTTLGRGGSDLSAALFAYSIDADEVQIWTDVDGILTADPKIIPNVQVVRKMIFEEVGELSFFGAKVLHPETIKPAIAKNIPVRILNTFNSKFEGTLILPPYRAKELTGVFHSLIFVGTAVLVSKRLDTDSKDAHFYFNLLQKNFPNLIFFAENINNFYAIIKGSILSNFLHELLQTEKIETRTVEIIAIVGNQVLRAQEEEQNKIYEILTSFSDYLALPFPLIVSDYSLLLVAKPTLGMDLLKESHSILFS
jgi:aspartate kinase